MAIEMLVGLNVSDDESYQKYREHMMPLLTAVGGGFSYDFRISEVLQSVTPAPINRLFTIYFPDQQSADAFFANADYLAIRKLYFESSVSDITRIASYEK